MSAPPGRKRGIDSTNKGLEWAAIFTAIIAITAGSTSDGICIKEDICANLDTIGGTTILGLFFDMAAGFIDSETAPAGKQK